MQIYAQYEKQMQDMQYVCNKYAIYMQNMQKMCKTYAKEAKICKIHARYIQDVCKNICKIYAKYMKSICTK